MTDLPRAVLWDMDGTLLDSEKLWDIGMAELAVKLGITMTPELRHRTLGTAMYNTLDLIFDAAGTTDRDHDRWARWLSNRVTQLFDTGIPWRPGAQAALDTIAGLGIPMLLVTNTGRELTEHALQTIGKHRFLDTFCGDEVPQGKPAPDIYLAAAARAGFDPIDCLAVEDSPTGTRAAAAAGCPTLVIPSEGEVPDGPGRVFATTLVGLDAHQLGNAWDAARQQLLAA